MLFSSKAMFGLVVFPLLSAFLSLVDVRWATQKQDSLTLTAAERGVDVQRCLESSLQAKLRFELRVCRKRSGWVDYCEESRSELHTVTYDEVTESYRFVSDRLDDQQEPIAIEIPARAEAIRLTTTIENMPLDFLSQEEPDIIGHSGAYLQVRTVFMCRGNSSRPFAHISRILTLGILNTVQDRSGWRDFMLHVTKNES